MEAIQHWLNAPMTHGDGVVLFLGLVVGFGTIERQLSGISGLVFKVLGSVDGRYADDPD